MTFPGYLALTAAEFTACDSLPTKPAWMACHFSCYGTGLSNCPTSLPEGAMLIVNDRTPPAGHDPQCITRQLTELIERLHIGCVLLDLQRPGIMENAQIAAALQSLPCPTAVSSLYAKELSCPVFLPPVPPHISAETYFTPWKEREIWLEAAHSCELFTVTEKGSRLSYPIEPPREHPHIFRDEKLNCHYCMDEAPDEVRFTLWREPEDVTALLQEAQCHGVTQSVGLYQELGSHFTHS